MKLITKTTTYIFLVLILVACSRKKNTFLSRNYHAVTAEYNAIFNGDEALANGNEQLSLTYKDNFWELLPVERFEVKETLDPYVKPGEKVTKNNNASNSSGFERAEEKAAKAIQKHSIYIDGKEYNPQIDEAYMLLGKARYYSQRFVPAQDAFNFILNRYPTSNNINEARMWKAKTNIQMGNEEGALEELKRVFDKKDIKTNDKANAAAIMAQAYINLDTLEAALPLMKLASQQIKDNELKGRYSYIKGQLYNRLGQKDSANMAFDEVIELNRKSPRVYMINAYMEKMRNFDYDKGDRVAFLELLNDLEQNRENRPYLDLIYNQFGEFFRNTKEIDTAVQFYNKSIKKYNENKPLQALNYSTLAEINFDDAKYRTAGKYYDSTLTFLEEKSRPWRIVKKKLDNLTDVIKYEEIAVKNDSILYLAALSETDLFTYFKKYTDSLKAKAVQDSIALAKAQEKIANKEFYKKAAGSNKGGDFYFYNSATVAYGVQEFKSIWGDRKLEDYWRLSSKPKNIDPDALTEGGEEEKPESVIPESEKYNPETYIATIPRDQKVIDSLTKDRNFAYYQLGLIYKEKFREYNLASNKLEKLLTYNPEERLVLPSKYNLYKIYTVQENTTLANKWKDDILNNHPNSRYAEILRNPNTQLATDESSPEFKYKALYKEFEASNYDEVIATCEEYINLYNGNEIVPKLEMLKATALGRRDGFEAYKKAVNFVALNYPQADEGKEAQKIYSTIIPQLQNKDFMPDEASDSWKVVYPFTASNYEDAKKLKEQLDKAITEYNYTNMSASLDYYNPTTYFVIIHGLNTKLGGRGFAQGLKENKKYKIKNSFFEIATPNYKTIQIHKTLEDYLALNSEAEK